MGGDNFSECDGGDEPGQVKGWPLPSFFPPSSWASVVSCPRLICDHLVPPCRFSAKARCKGWGGWRGVASVTANMRAYWSRAWPFLPTTTTDYSGGAVVIKLKADKDHTSFSPPGPLRRWQRDWTSGDRASRGGTGWMTLIHDYNNKKAGGNAIMD